MKSLLIIFISIITYVKAAPQFDSDEVHKHIFAYVAPDEPEPDVIRPSFDAKTEKHYKILFIKAPQPATPRFELPTIGGGPDIRTLVYVLQPKGRDIQVPTLIQTTTAKPAPPQVFFIKYNPQGRQ